MKARREQRSIAHSVPGVLLIFVSRRHGIFSSERQPESRQRLPFAAFGSAVLADHQRVSDISAYGTG